jgi:hypothetical protein
MQLVFQTNYYSASNNIKYQAKEFKTCKKYYQITLLQIIYSQWNKNQRVEWVKIFIFKELEKIQLKIMNQISWEINLTNLFPKNRWSLPDGK